MGYINEDNSYLISLLSDMSMVAGYIREGDSFCGGACGSLNASGELGAQLKQFLDIDKNQAVPVAEQIDRLRSYVSRYMEEISNVDRGITSEFDHIASEQEVDVHYSSVDSILRNDKITQYGKILLLLGIFGPVLGPILWTIYKYREKVHINDDHYTTTTPPPTQDDEQEQQEQPKPEEKPVVVNEGKIKGYLADGDNYKGRDYSNYKVVASYNSGFRYNQNDYSFFRYQKKDKNGNLLYDKNGNPIMGNDGCSCSAEAMIYNMKHPDEQPLKTPLDTRVNANSHCYGEKHSEIVEGSKDLSETEKMNMCARIVSEGEPLMMRVGNHHIVVMGVRDGADPNNIQMSDLLCVDPWDGMVKTVEEVGKKPVTAGWSLRRAV